MKCLAKKPADRWQSAEELLQHLEPLATPSGGTTPTQTAPVVALMAGHRRAVVAGTVGAIVVLVAVGAVAGQLLRSRPLAITVSDLTQVTTEPGVEFQPAISPDGQEVAYVTGPIAAPHIVVRSTKPTAGGGEVRLSDSSFDGAWIPAWSGDGVLVRFGGCRPKGCSWNETGKLGGSARPAVLPAPGESSYVAWSADGTRAAYFVGETLFVATVAAASSPRRIAVHPGRVWGPHSLAWSPDGKWIAYVNGNPGWVTSGNVSASSIWIVSANGGTTQRVTTEEHLNVSPAWLDDRHLLFVSNQDGARGVYVVEVGPQGARGASRIIPGVADPHSISYSIASHQLAWSKFTLRQNIWSYPLGRAAPVSIRDGVRVTTGNEVSEVGDVSPDGKWLAYDSNLRGNMDLYKVPLSGGAPVQITDAPWDEFNPRWSPDGAEIVFYATRTVGALESSLMIVPAAGGKAVPLTNAPRQNAFPVWSANGLHIAFMSDRTGTGDVWVLSRDSVGGTWHPEVQLTDSGGVPNGWTPDGSGVLCRRGSLGFIVSLQRRVLWRLDLARFGLEQRSHGLLSRDGKTYYLLARHRDGRYGLWAIPMSGDGVPRLAVAADQPALVPVEAPFSVTRDRLYMAVSEYESDIWVAKLKW